MALIHVVIPVYNAKQFLRETVVSVLDQPCKDIDIVLVDDGSTDGSAALCDELAAEESRVSVIHQQNQGVSVARNTGIEHFLNKQVEGYMAFLDADDLWFPHVLDGSVPVRLQGMNYTDVFVFGCTSSNGTCSRYAVPRRYAEETIQGGNGAIWKVQRHFCANLYAVNLLRNFGIRFVPGLKYSEDKIFAMQCLFLARNVTFMPEVLHVYRENTHSAMRKVFSYTPVDYYTPIIDGWIASDLFLNGMGAETGRSTDAGFVLSSIYFMDMAMEHHKQWRPSRDLKKAESHPYYYLFENMKQNCVTPKQYRDHKLLLNHPGLYKLKYNAVGAVEYAVRLAMRLASVRAYLEKKRYPLTALPECQ